MKRLAAKPRIGGLDSQPRPSGPTKPGGPQEPGAGRHAMCPGEEATRRQPHRPDGRGLFAAIRAKRGAIITQCSERPMAAHVLAATPPLLPKPQAFPQNGRGTGNQPKKTP